MQIAQEVTLAQGREQEVFRVDYQVDRFWGEVCERAPSVLRPVPPDLVPFVESRPEDWPEDWGEDDSETTWSAHLWHLGHRMFSEEAPGCCRLS